MRLRLLAGIAVLVGALTVVPSPASAAPTAAASVATLVRGPLRGVVYARAAGDENVEPRFSLAGMEPGRDYAVVGSQRPCSQGDVAGIDETWAHRFTADEDGHAFVQRRVDLWNPFTHYRSTRVHALGPLEQVACAEGVLGRVGTPGTVAAPNAAVATWVRGPFRGIAYARASGEILVDVRVALEGMDPNTTHLLVGSRLPCSRPARDSQSVWIVDFDSDADGNRTFRRRLTERSSLSQQRSTRLYELNDPGQFGDQVSCVAGVVGRLAPP